MSAYLPLRQMIVSKWFPSGGTVGKQAFSTAIDTSGTHRLSGNGYLEQPGVDFIQVNAVHSVPAQQWTHFAAYD